MSLEKCAVNHKIDKNEIAANAQAYLKRGLSENEAYIAAANDKIADLKEDEHTIVDAIMKAYEAGGFKTVEAEKPNKKDAENDNDGALFSNVQPTFYSQLSRSINDIKINKADPKMWQGMIKNLAQKGVKPDEIEWTGINDWLELQQGVVTKEQVLDYLNSNGVQIAPNKKKSQEIKNKAIELYTDGLASGAVAGTLNIGETTVLRWIKAAGITRTVAETKGVTSEKIESAVKFYQDGNSVFESAKKAGIGNSILFRVLQARDLSRPYSETNNIPNAIKEQAVDLFSSGMTSYEVADELGLTQTSVSKWVKDAGVSRGYSGAQALRVANGRLTGYGIKAKFNSQKNNAELKADSVYELARFYQLESDDSVKSFSRSKDRIPYGENSTYVPDIEVIYNDGSKVVEEIKPAFKVEDEKVQAKAKGAREYYSDKNTEYRFITENDIGIENFDKVSPESTVENDEDIKRVKASLASVRWALRKDVAMRDTIQQGLPLFSKNNTSYGMTAQAVRNAIANDIFRHNIDVYESMNDAPDYIRVQAKSEGRLGIEGFFDRQTNRVALIASNLTNTQRALEVARHELIGHFGMENMMPKQAFNQLVEQVKNGLNVGNKVFKDISNYVDENQPNLAPNRHAREIIAVMAERNLQNSIVKRVLDAVRTFLKKLGFIQSDITDAKVASLLRDAQAYLKTQGRGIVESSASFSNTEQTNTPAFLKWFGDSKVVDESGKPQVIYHGTDKAFYKVNMKKGAQGLFWFTSNKSAIESGEVGAAGNGVIMEMYAKIENPAGWKEYDKFGTGELVARGYDGVILPDSDGSFVGFVFEPNQVKSATKNNGNFDIDNNDIRFSNNKIIGDNSLPDESKESLFRRKAQDYFNRFKDIQDFLKKSGIDLNENEDVYGSEERSYGRKASRIEDFREQTLKPLVEKTIDLGFTMQQVSLVAHAQHAQERNEQIASINEQLPDGGSGMTTTDARAFLSGHAITYNGKSMQMSVADIAKIQPVVNGLRAITEQSKSLLLDNGIISQEMAGAWDSTYKNYVPLKGGDEAAQTGTGGGYSVNGKQKRALGHGEREENIVENIIRDHEKAIILAENNLVGKHLLNLAIKVSDPSIISIDKPVKRATYVKGQTSYVVSYEGSPIAVYENKQDANAFKREQALTLKRNIANFEISLSTGDPRVQYMATNMLQDNEAIVYVGGKQVKMQINDELMANAYRKLGIEQINGILKVGRDINNFLSKAYTGYNPEFLTTNIQRDFTTGLINVTGKHGIGVSKDAVLGYPKAFSDMFMYSMAGKTTKSITAYRASGGGTGAAYLGDIERIGDDVQKVYDDYVGVIANYKAGENMKAVRVAGDKLVGGLAGWISHLNAAGENAMRLSVFQAVLKKTGSMNEAASAAKNSTVNFNRKGEWGGTLSSLYLFANPNIQGTAIIYDTLIKGEHKGQAWALVGGLVGLKLLSRLQWGDDDDDKKRWNSINQSIRDRNLLIRVGKEKYITIALPYGYNFFGNIADGMMDLKDGVDTQKVAMHLSSSWFENFSPVGNPIPNDKMTEKSLAHLVPFTPLKTGMEFAVNENGLGSPIYPDNRFNENKADYLSMYRSSIGGPYEKIASSLHNATGTPGQNDGIDVSPESIKFWWNTVAGGTGRTVVDTASLIKSQTYNRATEDNQDALKPELSEIPMLRKLVRETTINDVRQQYFQATDDAKKAHDAYKNAQDFSDTKTMNDIKQNEKELLSLAEFADKKNKVISAKKNAIIGILADKKLSDGEKRLKIKEIENRERKIYEGGVAIVH